MKSILITCFLALGLIQSQSCAQKKTDASGQEISAAKITTVDAAKFKELINAQPGTILDVRTPEEFAEGYVPSATLMNVYDANFEIKATQLPKDEPVYVYCRSGKRSMQASELLLKNGFTKVYNLDGGFNSWKDSGMEIGK